MLELIIKDSVSAVTKTAMRNFNKMGDMEFFMKYSVTKAKYLHRVIKYGDPYMNAPLAKFGKWLGKLQR